MIITYIIESQGYYKIGRTDDMERRITEYNTHNPKYEVIHIISMDCESFLHKHFESKRVRFEWFDLLNEDIDWIKSNHELLSQNTQEIKDKKAKEDRDIIKAEKKKNQMEMREKRNRDAILKRNLEDKEQEEWLLKMLKENPKMFSN